MKRVLNLILTHQGAEEINRMLAWWARRAPEAEILLAITGAQTDLSKVDHPQKIFVGDVRLSTRDHQRELQSYTAVMAEAAHWLRARPYDFVHFAEYDHLPLRADFNALQLEYLEREKADVLCFNLDQVDDTSHPHYVYHKSDPRFHAYWESVSQRADRRTVLSNFGTGSFWTRAAFEAVAARPEPFPMYLEIWLPTLAHHLGFRVRPFKGTEAAGFIMGSDLSRRMDEPVAAGAWTAHPVKTLPVDF